MIEGAKDTDVADGPVARGLRRKLTEALSPLLLEIEDDSHRHAGHHRHGGVDGQEGGESHFNLKIVSAAFHGLSRVARQRLVNAALREELAGPVHALSLQTLTPQEADISD